MNDGMKATISCKRVAYFLKTLINSFCTGDDDFLWFPEAQTNADVRLADLIEAITVLQAQEDKHFEIIREEDAPHE